MIPPPWCLSVSGSMLPPPWCLSAMTSQIYFILFCQRIWGFAKSEEAVIVTFMGREYRTVASRAPYTRTYTERAAEATHIQKFFQ